MPVPLRFSIRTGWNREPSPLAKRLEEAAHDLTETNPTRCNLDYPFAELAAAWGQAALFPYQPEPFGLASAREALAASLHLRAETTLLTASTSESYAALFKLLTDPGDTVLVPRPSYPLFDYLTGLEGVRPKDYLLAPDFSLDVSAVDAAGDETTRAVVIVSPHHPTGMELGPATHVELQKLCLARGWALIHDAVFAPRFPREPTECLTFTLGGLSKLAALPQLKLGWISVSGPPEAVKESRGRLELILDTSLSLATPVQHALPAILELVPKIQGVVQERLARNRETLRAVRPEGALWSIHPTGGAWSALLRLPDSLDEDEACSRCLDRGVAVYPGYFFDFPRGHWLILSLLVSPGTFKSGVHLLAAALAP